jgi:uncharacterized protein (TIGR03083 family)
MTKTREQVLDEIRREQAAWRTLVDEVGRDRMDEPGPMGVWTFRDLVGHLAGWRNRRLGLLEAKVRGEPDPGPPWPPGLDDDDRINAWIREHDAGRTTNDLLADYDRSFDRLAAVFRDLPDEVLSDRNAFSWMEGTAPIDGDWFAHLHDEHEPSIRAWLAERDHRTALRATS